MDKYRSNLYALDNIAKTNKNIDDTEKVLKCKHLYNKRRLVVYHTLLDDSFDKYHSIIRNLDSFLS